uniref:Uncharacterized protein n=1 Tax=Caenorhabditis japonica TaxID=281687 RepID=A0A8R1E7C5_CAEJA
MSGCEMSQLRNVSAAKCPAAKCPAAKRLGCETSGCEMSRSPSITIGTTEYAPSCQITVCASTAANLYAATSHRTFQKDTTRLSTRAAIKGGQSNHSGAVCVTTPLSTFYTCFGS